VKVQKRQIRFKKTNKIHEKNIIIIKKKEKYRITPFKHTEIQFDVELDWLRIRWNIAVALIAEHVSGWCRHGFEIIHFFCGTYNWQGCILIANKVVYLLLTRLHIYCWQSCIFIA